MFSAVDQALVLDVLPERDTDAARYVNVMQFANDDPAGHRSDLAAAALLTIGVVGAAKALLAPLHRSQPSSLSSAGFVILKVKPVR